MLARSLPWPSPDSTSCSHAAHLLQASVFPPEQWVQSGPPCLHLTAVTGFSRSTQSWCLPTQSPRAPCPGFKASSGLFSFYDLENAIELRFGGF